MISIYKLSINFTGDFLFKEVSFVVGDRDRIGLVGKNGAGKSTLLKILHKTQEPETGTIVVTSGHKTGYLPQEMTSFGLGKSTKIQTVWEETVSAFIEQKRLEKQIVHVTEQLLQRTDYESDGYHKLVQQLSDYTEHFHILGGSTMDADAEKVLLGLGFKSTDFERPINEFSSGWQMRVALAKILLQKPEIILLDEPTNHLDIESIQWLEEYLSNYEGALIMVSHDRTFLDRVTNRTIEITLGTIQDYKCSYSEYVEQRLERIETQQAAYENQQREVAQIERFIERFRYKASKAKQVQSRVKLLGKIDRVNVEELDESAISFKFPPAPHSGKITVEAKQLSLGYGALNILNDIDLHLERGERVAFVGRNGEGKSTFVKSIVGELRPQNGSIQIGHQVVIGYYAQNQALLLDPTKTVFETIDDIALGDIRPKIRTILGRFLFSTEDTEKRVSVLSGGEKSRLALAKLLLSPFNLLILDEPTNHLDMASKDVLKNALLHYEGCLVIVSHDRDFLSGLCEKIFEFKDKKIKTFIGDVYEFLEKKKLDSLNELQRKASNSAISDSSSSENKDNYLFKKEQEAQNRKVANQIKKVEREIEELHKELIHIETKLAMPEQFAVDIANGSLYATYEQIKSSIAEKEERWLGLQL